MPHKKSGKRSYSKKQVMRYRATGGFKKAKKTSHGY